MEYLFLYATQMWAYVHEGTTIQLVFLHMHADTKCWTTCRKLVLLKAISDCCFIFTIFWWKEILLLFPKNALILENVLFFSFSTLLFLNFYKVYRVHKHTVHCMTWTWLQPSVSGVTVCSILNAPIFSAIAERGKHLQGLTEALWRGDTPHTPLTSLF